MDIAAFVATLGAIAFATIAWAWSVVWAVVVGLFWLVMVIIVGAFAMAILRPELMEKRQAPPPSPTPTIDAMRAALRSTELDGDIERINMRNAQRRNA